MPDRPWVMTQTWSALLFAHWPVDAAQLRDKIPRAFDLDLFDGEAWLGVVAFVMTNVAPRGVPALPWMSAFPELNVRAYVRVGDRPGVYFLSLDAGNALAAGMARLLVNLPYHAASMTVTRAGAAVHYESRRRRGHGELSVTYQPDGGVFEATPGSREAFLTERYCLYALDHAGRPYRLDIHHPPWRLQPARASLAQNTMAEANGVTLSRSTPLLHFSERQDVVAWLPCKI